ncbi:MAG TPA: DUF2807 domain-containing protein [Bacteroidales bacterium]|nr:DUF2807 domain-containing protein [Bacteroidales bacterium]HPS16431.1 DUF2807 domain-containing protein [Bacteroidales bacterium]
MKVVFNNIIYVLMLSITLILFTTCTKEKRCDCLKSTGDIVTEERTVAEFSQVRLESKINLFLKQDTFNSIKIEAGENLLPDIYTNVEDSVLVIRNDNHCNWVRSYKPKINVYLTFKDFWHFIYYKGAGTVITEDTIYTNFFQLDDNEGTGSLNFLLHTNTSWFNIHTGPADLTVKGVSGLNYLYTCGNGPADLRDFKTNLTYLTSKATANDYIWVTGELDAWIDYTGNVYYSGNPSKITYNYTGSGRLIPF